MRTLNFNVIMAAKRDADEQLGVGQLGGDQEP